MLSDRTMKGAYGPSANCKKMGCMTARTCAASYSTVPGQSVRGDACAAARLPLLILALEAAHLILANHFAVWRYYQPEIRASPVSTGGHTFAGR
jgi:hypothetical protein